MVRGEERSSAVWRPPFFDELGKKGVRVAGITILPLFPPKRVTNFNRARPARTSSPSLAPFCHRETTAETARGLELSSGVIRHNARAIW